jgi:hypothetical protein
VYSSSTRSRKLSTCNGFQYEQLQTLAQTQGKTLDVIVQEAIDLGLKQLRQQQQQRQQQRLRALQNLTQLRHEIAHTQASYSK